MASPNLIDQINRSTGVTAGRQYSVPNPALKTPGTSLVPLGGKVKSGPEVKVTDDFFKKPGGNVPNFTTKPNYAGSIPPNKSLVTTPQSGFNVKGMAQRLGKGLIPGVADYANSQALGNDLANGAFTDEASRMGDIGTAGRALYHGVSNVLSDMPKAFGVEGSYQGSPAQGVMSYLFDSKNNQQPSLGASGDAKPAQLSEFNKAEAGAVVDSLLSKQNPNSQGAIFKPANMQTAAGAVAPVQPTEQAANAATDRPAAGVTMDQSRYNKTGPMRPITTFNDGVGGSASVQFADGRTLNETQQNDLQRTIARNADPAVQAKFAEQAAISQGRYDRAKAFDVAKQREQQEAMLNNQMQGARNTLLQPAITGDLFAMRAQNQNKKAAAAMLGIGNDSRQVDNQRIANDQENQIKNRHYLFEEQAAEQDVLAEAAKQHSEAAKQQAEAQQRQSQNQLETKKLNKIPPKDELAQAIIKAKSAGVPQEHYQEYVDLYNQLYNNGAAAL